MWKHFFLQAVILWKQSVRSTTVAATPGDHTLLTHVHDSVIWFQVQNTCLCAMCCFDQVQSTCIFRFSIFESTKVQIKDFRAKFRI